MTVISIPYDFLWISVYECVTTLVGFNMTLLAYNRNSEIPSSFFAQMLNAYPRPHPLFTRIFNSPLVNSSGYTTLFIPTSIHSKSSLTLPHFVLTTHRTNSINTKVNAFIHLFWTELTALYNYIKLFKEIDIICAWERFRENMSGKAMSAIALLTDEIA